MVNKIIGFVGVLFMIVSCKEKYSQKDMLHKWFIDSAYYVHNNKWVRSFDNSQWFLFSSDNRLEMSSSTKNLEGTWKLEGEKLILEIPDQTLVSKIIKSKSKNLVLFFEQKYDQRMLYLHYE